MCVLHGIFQAAELHHSMTDMTDCKDYSYCCQHSVVDSVATIMISQLSTCRPYCINRKPQSNIPEDVLIMGMQVALALPAGTQVLR